MKDIYASDWFQSALTYAKSLKSDAIYVLSAKHGLLGLNDEIAPYELTLKNMHVAEKKAWADRVVAQLVSVSDLQHDHFVILAGKNYRMYLVPHLAHYEVPMEGLRFGEQLQFLKGRI